MAYSCSEVNVEIANPRVSRVRPHPLYSGHVMECFGHVRFANKTIRCLTLSVGSKSTVKLYGSFSEIVAILKALSYSS